MTAIEIVVILAVTATLAVLAVSTLGNVEEITRTKGAAEQVASAIQQSRAYAVTHAAIYQVTFPGNTQVGVSCVTFCGASAPADAPTDLIHGASVNPPGTPISFDSTGASNGGTVVVNPGPLQKTVTVTLAGRVQITTP